MFVYINFSMKYNMGVVVSILLIMAVILGGSLFIGAMGYGIGEILDYIYLIKPVPIEGFPQGPKYK